MKPCIKCGVVKPIGEFPLHTGSGKPRNVCGPCKRVYDSEYMHRTMVRHLAGCRRRRNERPEQYLTNERRYRERHKERVKEFAKTWRLNNPEARKIICRRWSQKNKPRRMEYKQVRRARELLAMPEWANRKMIVALNSEAVRMTAMTGIPHEVDHIVPLQSPVVCGLHWEANLQVLPRRENRAKLNRYWPDMP